MTGDDRSALAEYLAANPAEHSAWSVHRAIGAARGLSYQQTRGDLRRLEAEGLISRREQLAGEVEDPSTAHLLRGWRHVYRRIRR